MRSPEEREAAATRAVVGRVARQVSRLGFILREDGHPDVVRRINEAMVWATVSRNVMMALAEAATRRSQAAQAELSRLRDFLDGATPAPGVDAADAAGPAQQELISRARELLRTLDRPQHFDRAVALKVWAEHRRVLGKLAGARNLAGLVEALEALGRGAVGKATGAEYLGLIVDLLNAARTLQRAAADASKLNYFLDAIIYAHAKWSLDAQCQVLRLEPSGPRVPEAEIVNVARERVMNLFESHWRAVS